MKERPSDVEDRLTGADPSALGVVQLDREAGAARDSLDFEKIERKARRADHRPAHEYRVGRWAVAKAADDRLGFQKIAVGLRRERPVRHRFTLRDRGETAHPIAAIALASLL